MSEWLTKELDSVANIAIGGTPSRAVAKYWASTDGDGECWVSIADLRHRIVGSSKERITQEGVNSSNVKRVSAGTLIMSFKLSIGRAAIAGCDLYTNEAIAAIIPKLGKIEAEYLYYILPPKAANAITDTAVKGSTLNKKTLGKLSLTYPEDGCVQKKIANILQTIDEAIEQTEALIEKYSLVKAGMMHDLFTRGLTPDGKLRPPREEAPDLYKETPIGWLPEEWDCSDLQDLLAPLPNNLRSGPFGSALLKSELVEDGIPFLGIDNIHVERFVPVYRRFVSDRKYRELIKYSVRPNDLVITIMGTVGRCAVVPETVETALSSKHLWTISLDQSAVIPALVCWQMNYASWVKKWFRRETQGGIMDAIQSKTLKTLKLPVPPMPEQILISDRYTALSDQLRFEQERFEKLQLQKSGLMHDLLTGEVSVTVNDTEAAHV